ncbi:hypothetical protein G6M89_14940 [Natronolimnobius sp. AArcel1]|uniref:hypothetical protein n=1 Tax=Natronolimnobius sp. AArcel1 TaxID=1679093 RepID=UPI0013E9E503|nr:hypothetical protein [Natronolimnobius sp. AArcel1]NGM70289.1 hypothetical protein [Natronolimnobius sp. AArcel1]
MFELGRILAALALCSVPILVLIRGAPRMVTIASGAASVSLLLVLFVSEFPDEWQLPVAGAALLLALPSFPYWIRAERRTDT